MILLTSSWNSYLSNLLLSQPVSDNNYPLLREFHRSIHDLQKIWHINLPDLVGVQPHIMKEDHENSSIW